MPQIEHATNSTKFHELAMKKLFKILRATSNINDQKGDRVSILYISMLSFGKLTVNC